MKHVTIYLAKTRTSLRTTRIAFTDDYNIFQAPLYQVQWQAIYHIIFIVNPEKWVL